MRATLMTAALHRGPGARHRKEGPGPSRLAVQDQLLQGEVVAAVVGHHNLRFLQAAVADLHVEHLAQRGEVPELDLVVGVAVHQPLDVARQVQLLEHVLAPAWPASWPR